MNSNHSRSSKYHFRLVIVAIFVTLSCALGAVAQGPSAKSDVRVRYINSAPKKSDDKKKTGIRVVKRSKAVGSLKKLEPADFKLERKTFELINKERAKKGLAKLI